MTGYGVKIVKDGDLPTDVEWMFVKGTDGSLLLYLTQSAAGCARALSEAWAAYRRLEMPPPQMPAQRDVLHLVGL